MTCWLDAECAASVRQHVAFMKLVSKHGTLSLCMQQPGQYLSGVLFKASQRVRLRRRCQIPQLDAAIPTSRCKNIFILLCMSSCTLIMFASTALQCIDTGAALHLSSASKAPTLYLQVSGLQSAPRSMHNHRDRPWCQMQQSGLVPAVMPALDILAVRHTGSWATQH